MHLALQILVAAFCLPLLLLGLRSMFQPRAIADAMSLEVTSTAGLNTIRGLVGGFFIANVAMLVVGLSTGSTSWFIAVAISIGAVLLGRFVGIALDGFDRAVGPPVAIELVIVAGLVSAYVVLPGA